MVGATQVWGYVLSGLESLAFTGLESQLPCSVAWESEASQLVPSVPWGISLPTCKSGVVGAPGAQRESFLWSVEHWAWGGGELI